MTEFRTTVSQLGFTVPCITCHERKSQNPSKTCTFLEEGSGVILPSVLMVVTSARVVRLYPSGWLMAHSLALLGKPIQVKFILRAGSKRISSFKYSLARPMGIFLVSRYLIR